MKRSRSLRVTAGLIVFTILSNARADDDGRTDAPVEASTTMRNKTESAGSGCAAILSRIRTDKRENANITKIDDVAENFDVVGIAKLDACLAEYAERIAAWPDDTGRNVSILSVNVFAAHLHDKMIKIVGQLRSMRTLADYRLFCDNHLNKSEKVAQELRAYYRKTMEASSTMSPSDDKLWPSDGIFQFSVLFSGDRRPNAFGVKFMKERIVVFCELQQCIGSLSAPIRDGVDERVVDERNARCSISLHSALSESGSDAVQHNTTEMVQLDRCLLEFGDACRANANDTINKFYFGMIAWHLYGDIKRIKRRVHMMRFFTGRHICYHQMEVAERVADELLDYYRQTVHAVVELPPQNPLEENLWKASEHVETAILSYPLRANATFPVLLPMKARIDALDRHFASLQQCLKENIGRLFEIVFP